MTDDLWPDEVTLTLGEAAHTLCGTDVSQHSANLTPREADSFRQLADAVLSGRLDSVNLTPDIDLDRVMLTRSYLLSLDLDESQKDRLKSVGIHVEALKEFATTIGRHPETLFGPRAPGATVTAAQTNNVFQTMGGLKWEEIKVVFVSETEVRVTAGGKRKRLTYIDLRFQDRRQAGVPPIQAWGLLLDFYARGREYREYRGNRKAQIVQIRERFRKYFGIKANPFYPYSNNRWIPKFDLSFERQPAGDEYPFDDENDLTAVLIREKDKSPLSD